MMALWPGSERGGERKQRKSAFSGSSHEVCPFREGPHREQRVFHLVFWADPFAESSYLRRLVLVSDICRFRARPDSAVLSCNDGRAACQAEFARFCVACTTRAVVYGHPPGGGILQRKYLPVTTSLKLTAYDDASRANYA